MRSTATFADRVVCNRDFKLWVEDGVATRLYQLSSDPLEQDNLIHSDHPAHVVARNELQAVVASFPVTDNSPRYTPLAEPLPNQDRDKSLKWGSPPDQPLPREMMKGTTQKTPSHDREAEDLRSDLTCVSGELEKTRQELAEQKSLFQRYFNLVDSIIGTLDREGNLERINRKGLELLAYREDELIGRNWFGTCLPQPEGLEVILPVFQDIMAGNLEGARYFENSIQAKNGRRRLIAWHNNYFRDQSGEIIGTISSGEDITDRRRVEEQKSRLLPRLRQAVDQIHTLQGILPLCSFCKKIRDDSDTWQPLESYLRDHSDADISHGVCPECTRKHYPELFRGE